MSVIIISCAAGCSLFQNEKENNVVLRGDNDRTSDYQSEENDDATTIFVYVCGEVNSPGVYQCKKGARLFEAIELAGGLTKEADLNSVNQAQVLEDGTKINILSINDSNDTQGSSLININSATKEQLMTLPGIGESKADSIVAYREKRGSFKSLEDLKNVEGIKDGVFNKIVDLISV